LNLLLFIIMLFIMISTLIRLKNENLQRSNDNDKKILYKNLIISVMFKSLAQFFILGCCRVILLRRDHNVIVFELFQFLSSQQGTSVFLVHCLLSHK
ncbi:adhesion G protein-coupled receptor E3-like, partial [Clarias magur]